MKTTVVGSVLLLSLICMVEAAPSMSCVGRCELIKNECVEAPCGDSTVPCSYCFDENAECKKNCPGKK